MSSQRPQGEYVCTHCKVVFVRSTSQANARLRQNRNLYCSRACHKAMRRYGRSDADLAARKLQYSREYTAKNIDQIRAKDLERYYRTTTLAKRAAKYAAYREKILDRNAKPENRVAKKEYDSIRRAKIGYGEFWESHVLLLALSEKLVSQSGKLVRQR